MTTERTDPTMPSLSAEDHRRFEEALVTMRARFGGTHALLIDGEDLPTLRPRAKHSPMDRGVVLGQFAAATEYEAGLALAAAERAFASWSKTPASERRAVIRRFLGLLESRAFEIAALLSLELGKTRREALREAWGTAELLVAYCDEWASHAPDVAEAVEGPSAPTPRRLRPHGPWVVFAPLHHPLALGAGPAAAALLAGNTVVLKPSEETPWTARVIAEWFREAGAPPGVLNLVSGSPEDMGEILFKDTRIAGCTFTGSLKSGQRLARQMAILTPKRPCIVEFTTKAARVVTAHADVDAAARSIASAAFHLTGQRASAPSHLFVQHDVADALIERLTAEVERMRIGDPTLRDTEIGPLVAGADVADYRQVAHLLHAHGAKVLFGGELLTGGGRGAGNFVAPTLAEVTRDDHPCWSRDLLLPVLMLRRYATPDRAVAAIALLERSRTVRVHGTDEEAAWFAAALESVEGHAPPGATSAWPTLLPSMRAEEASDHLIPGLHAYLMQYLHPAPGTRA